MTTFKIGQTVTAISTAQGLVAGTTYEVVQVIEDLTPWGNFVDYILVGEGCENGLIQIRNGHLLLRSA